MLGGGAESSYGAEGTLFMLVDVERRQNDSLPSFDVAFVDAVRPVPSRAVPTRGSELVRAGGCGWGGGRGQWGGYG
ncbi:MAG: hypothetical protein BJ554DRAFT_5795 [Olpidium bornovanus]|uniref:Uncharacterized protein n=1 Tax=Olpidium bornovanus TaxID=278681 RepID=A0A8H7ZYS5_9FUNG|nr:MAG: hypothetical protein BJ554DRAFT_5795 [Olpidium bornovanus]